MRSDLLDVVSATDPWPHSRPVDADLLEDLEIRRTLGPGPLPRYPRLVLAAAMVTFAALLGVAVWALTRPTPSIPVAPTPDAVTPETSMIPEQSPGVVSTVATPPAMEGSIEWAPLAVPFDADVDPLVDAGSRVYVVARGEGRVWSSEDGSNWVVSRFADEVHEYSTFVAWGDRLVGWEGGGEYSDGSGTFTIPGRVVVASEGGEAFERTFDDGVIGSVGIGPSGVVVALDSLDTLGAEGPRFTGWASIDGETWTSIEGFPQVGYVVGVERGFVGLDESEVWHSPDGLLWTRIGEGGTGSGDVARWKGNLVALDETGVLVVTESGVEHLGGPEAMEAWNPNLAMVTARDEEVVIIDLTSGLAHTSSDGLDWEAQILPADMASATEWGMWTPYAVQVGGAILARLYRPGGGFAAEWWLGEPDA